MGPWTGDTAASLTRHTVQIDPGTALTLVQRSARADRPGGFVREPIRLADVKVGDWVALDAAGGRGH